MATDHTWPPLPFMAAGRLFLPIAGGDGADDPPKDDPPAADPPKDDPPDNEPVKPEDDWKAKARKHERDAKREREARETAERALKEREDADKSEQEKALDKAREEARNEALSEADKDRRNDRLEVAVTRLAAKGVKVGDDTVRFDDPEDALVFIQREDTDGLFDDEGKVNADALEEALSDLLTRKPRLRAEGGSGSTPDSDARRGDRADEDLEDLTPEQWERRQYPENFK